jgi:Family of unknown function (DUF6312)
MATEAHRPPKGTTTSSTAPAAAPPTESLAAVEVTVEPKRKRKRRYSRGLKDVQRWERGWAKASRRLGRAVAGGLDSYLDRRDRSSYKRRDGAIRDALKNWSKAASKSMRRASGAPYDVLKAFNTKTVRRTIKVGTRTLAFPFLR